MTYPCKGCGAPACYELLPYNLDGLRLPSCWCVACWEAAANRATDREEAMRL